jgi:hypothetical protein
MSRLFYPADSSTPDAAVLTREGVRSTIDGTDIYLTNEVFLYRIIGMAADQPGEIVELEDCYTLSVALVPLRDLSARRLRVVMPASGEG